MEATSAIVILLFVVTIFSSLGGKQSTSLKKSGDKPLQQIEQTTFVSTLEAPNPNYIEDENAKADIKKYILKYRTEEEAEEISANVVHYSQVYDVNPKLVASLMARESRFNPNARSSSNAMGLGQLLPSTCKTVGIDDGFDIEQNCRGTVKYLSYLLNKFKSSNNQVPFAIAGYLEGPNGVERNQSYSSHAASYIRDIFDTYRQI